MSVSSCAISGSSGAEDDNFPGAAAAAAEGDANGDWLSLSNSNTGRPSSSTANASWSSLPRPPPPSFLMSSLLPTPLIRFCSAVGKSFRSLRVLRAFRFNTPPVLLIVGCRGCGFLANLSPLEFSARFSIGGAPLLVSSLRAASSAVTGAKAATWRNSLTWRARLSPRRSSFRLTRPFARVSRLSPAFGSTKRLKRAGPCSSAGVRSAPRSSAPV
mmetsp:Transcript_20001/g.39720  ORF Transcript_20001/g.39720 Transcript_20001/m.39720 type:complete len:215 (+) Transcript_20001:2003-2647(+)